MQQFTSQDGMILPPSHGSAGGKLPRRLRGGDEMDCFVAMGIYLLSELVMYESQAVPNTLVAETDFQYLSDAIQD
jgi:hypothetical protein